MRTRFGQHMIDGCAGENILVEVDREIKLDDLRKGMTIQTQDTGVIVHLRGLRVAAPCMEFSQFAANQGMPLAEEDLKRALQFLHNGRRGFYATAVSSQEAVALRAEDKVFVVDEGEERN